MTRSQNHSRQNAHQVLISWTKNGSKNVDAQTLEADGDATEEDKINVHSLRDVASGSSAEATPLRVEHLSPDNKTEHLRKLNTEKTAAYILNAPTTLRVLIS